MQLWKLPDNSYRYCLAASQSMIHERSFQSEQAQIEIDGWRAIAIDLFSNQVWYLFSISNFEFKF